MMLFLATGLFLLATGSGTAQPEKNPQRSGEQEALKRQQLRMQEDIEIMRRILKETLLRQSGYGLETLRKSGHGAAFLDYDQDGLLDLYVTNNYSGFLQHYHNLGDGKLAHIHAWSPEAQCGIHDIGAIEGTYLKGYGIHFSVSLPVHFQEVIAAPAKPAPPPISHWERVRKELRGEKMEAGDKRQERNEATLADRVLKVLAENGHNFHLADNEQLTVAITLRQPLRGQFCTVCHDPGGFSATWAGLRALRTAGVSTVDLDKGAGPGLGGKGAIRKGSGPENGPSGNSNKPAGGVETNGEPAGRERDAVVKRAVEYLSKTQYTEAWQAEAQNHVLLGDLHLKQERYKEAVAAYQRAVDVFQMVLDRQKERYPDGKASTNPRDYLKAIELYTKLTEGQLAAGDAENALKGYDKIAEYSRYLKNLAQRRYEADSSQPAGGKSAVPLPSKFLISAPKKLLDQVGAGKITFEEFRMGATVQFLNFAAATGTSGTPGSDGFKRSTPGNKAPGGNAP
jgi:hypothetical protein